MPEPSREEVGELIEKLTEREFAERTVGVDRNTPKGKQICASCEVTFTYSLQQSRRMRQRERSRRRLQRIGQYLGNVRKDFAHKTSRALLDDLRTRVIAFEDLKVKNMTARPKPKQDENGKWLKNGAGAKAGLNRILLGSAWGKVYHFTRCKALRAAMLTVKVAAPDSSQQCARCGHTHPDNRSSQAVFVCQRCGQTRNADENAARVIKQRGIPVVLSGKWRECPPKKTMRLKCKSVGPERPKPAPAIDTRSQEPTPAQIHIRHGRDRTQSAYGSLNPQTPASAQRLAAGSSFRPAGCASERGCPVPAEGVSARLAAGHHPTQIDSRSSGACLPQIGLSQARAASMNSGCRGRRSEPCCARASGCSSRSSRPRPFPSRAAGSCRWTCRVRIRSTPRPDIPPRSSCRRFPAPGPGEPNLPAARCRCSRAASRHVTDDPGPPRRWPCHAVGSGIDMQGARGAAARERTSHPIAEAASPLTSPAVRGPVGRNARH